MLSERFVINDTQWALMEPHCFGKKGDPGRTGGDSRVFMEAVLWIARTGAPWRDLPERYGSWKTADGTICKVHRHGQGAKGGLKARL